MSFTDKWETDVLNYLLNGVSMGLPSTLYMGVHIGSSAPTDAGTGFVEPTGGAYARVALPRSVGTFAVPTGGVANNLGLLSFPLPTTTWGTATHFGIFDASTGGNAVIIAALNTPKLIAPGDSPTFGVGACTITLS